MILNIYKPSTWTSFDVVKKIKIITKEKKVGHGGTLDPFAEGVLMIGTNIDTKKLSNISRCNKTYTATIKLGIHTDSFDRDGKIIKTNEVPILNEVIIKSVLQSFIGHLQTFTTNVFCKKKEWRKIV